MTPRLPWVLSAALLMALVFVLFQGAGYLEPEERALHDSFQAAASAGPDAARDAEITVVEITDDCVERYGPWPWRRSLVAELVGQIGAARPASVAVDFLFLEPDPEEDPRLVRAIREAGNVVLAAEVVRRTVWDNERGEPVPRLDLLKPAPALARHAARLGFVNVDYFRDNQDGVVRKLPLGVHLEGRTVGVLAAEAVSQKLGVDLGLGPHAEARLGSWNIPVDPPRETHERVGGARRDHLEVAFLHSVYLRYLPDASQGAIPTLRAMDVLTGEIPASRFQGRVVLVGLDVHGLDRKVTPVGNLAGVEMQAQMVRNLLRREVLTRIPPGTSRALAVALLLLAACLAAFLPTLQTLLVVVLVPVAWYLLAWLAFARAGLLLDVYAPALAFLVGTMTGKLVVLTLEVRDHIRHLAALHESSRRFSRSLDLESLQAEVLDRYRELLGAEHLALCFCLGEDPEPHAYFTDGFPGGVRALFGRHRLQQELIRLLRVPDKVVPGARLREVPDFPSQKEVPKGALIFPLGRFERAMGWVLALGTERRPSARGEEGRFWSTHASVTATGLENAGLYQMATVDALTGLYIRHYFDLALRRELARVGRHEGALALLMTDIDHFKRFNDTHGHQVGDRVLRHVAEVVRETVRDLDIPCRYGGEEFSVILPDTGVEGASLTAERIRKRIEESPLEVEGESLGVTISIGVACSARTGQRSAEGFVEEADQALYRAKDQGRNRVEMARAG